MSVRLVVSPYEQVSQLGQSPSLRLGPSFFWPIQGHVFIDETSTFSEATMLSVGYFSARGRLVGLALLNLELNYEF